MSEWLLSHEPGVRLGFFLLVFVACLSLERLLPRRTYVHSRSRRWFSNLGLSVVGTVVVRVLVVFPPVALAVWAESNQIGILHFVALPGAIAILLSLLLFDLVIYGQHVIFHKVPMLWKLHQIHHTDQDLDVSSALRFHPVEILLSMAIKGCVILVLGPPAIAVLLFEVILNAAAMFNHSNLHLPAGLDRLLRCVVVTPDMHRVHHSVIRTETNSNYGFNLPWWDRLFKTYQPQPARGHEGMTLGLEESQRTAPFTLSQLLMLPLRRLNARDS